MSWQHAGVLHVEDAALPPSRHRLQMWAACPEFRPAQLLECMAPVIVEKPRDPEMTKLLPVVEALLRLLTVGGRRVGRLCVVGRRTCLIGRSAAQLAD